MDSIFFVFFLQQFSILPDELDFPGFLIGINSFDINFLLPQDLFYCLKKRLQTFSGLCRHLYDPVCLKVPYRQAFPDPVHLVKCRDHRFVHCLQTLQCLIHHIHLLVHLWIGKIRHMQNHIRIFCFLQGTSERFNQVVRKLADKSYRIREQNLLISRKSQHSRGRIQCCEQLVLLQHFCPGQGI